MASIERVFVDIRPLSAVGAEEPPEVPRRPTVAELERARRAMCLAAAALALLAAGLMAGAALEFFFWVLARLSGVL